MPGRFSPLPSTFSCGVLFDLFIIHPNRSNHYICLSTFLVSSSAKLSLYGTLENIPTASHLTWALNTGRYFFKNSKLYQYLGISGNDIRQGHSYYGSLIVSHSYRHSLSNCVISGDIEWSVKGRRSNWKPVQGEYVIKLTRNSKPSETLAGLFCAAVAVTFRRHYCFLIVCLYMWLINLLIFFVCALFFFDF